MSSSQTDPADSHALRPRSLTDVPAVEATLREAGLGTFAEEPTAARGRNENWLGRTTTGEHVFVKLVAGSPETVRERVTAITVAQHVLAEVPAVQTPELLATDAGEGIVVFRRLLDAADGGSLLRDDELSDDVAEDVGRALAATHGARVPEGAEVSTAPSPLPPVGSLTALPLAVFPQLSAAELETWSLLQQDRELVAALAALRQDEAAAPKVPIHGDLRLDQFLLADGDLWLCDWEEFRLGDAARDLGALVGEFLNHAFSALTETEDGATVDHASIMRRGSERLEEILPTIRRTIDAYEQAVGHPVDDMLLRACRFAGWHLIDRLLAAAHEKARLHPLARAVAGIGRSIVTGPAAMMENLRREGVPA